ncbi:hypothetical protein U1Q18_041328 [Sarracenia purpurea var. burkii]
MHSIPAALPSLADHLTVILSRSNRLSHGQLQQIHGQLLTNGFVSSTTLLTDFLNSCYRSRNNLYSLLFLQNLPKPDPLLWDAMVRISLECENWQDFQGFYNGLRENNLVPSKSTISLILHSCANLRAIQLGESFHCQILKLGFVSDMILQTGLLLLYAKVGHLGLTKQVFAEMTERDVVANNAMISALKVYYEGASVGIPFTWESQPGTPKVMFHENPLPPLIPSPFFHFSSMRKQIKRHPKSNLFCTVLSKLSLRRSSHPPSTASSLSSSSPSVTSSQFTG